MLFAAEMAFEDGFLDDIIPNRSFSFNWQVVQTDCNPNKATADVLPLLLGRGVEPGRLYDANRSVAPIIALVGCSCSGESTIVSQMAGAMPVPVPVISGSSTNPKLSDKAMYPFFARVIPSDSKQGAGLVALLRTLGGSAPGGGWRRVVLLATSDAYSEGIAAVVMERAADGDITVVKEPLPYAMVYYEGDAPLVDYASLQKAARRIAATSPLPRVFLYTLFGWQSPLYISALRTAGLFTADFTVLASESMADEGVFAFGTFDLLTERSSAWHDECVAAGNTEMAALFADGTYWQTLISVTDGWLALSPRSRGPRFESQRFQDFWMSLTADRLMEAAADQGFKLDEAGFKDMTVLSTDFYAPFAFDATTAVLLGIGQLLSAGCPPEEVGGQRLQDAILHATFEGLTGSVSFDANGDRLGSYSILNFRQGRVVVDIGSYSAATEELSLEEAPIFATGGTSVPRDRPAPCQKGYQFSEGICEPCIHGSYSPADDSICFPCPVGTFASGQGSVGCVFAPMGSYVDLEGSTAAHLCTPGFFTDQVGASSCKPCHIGFYSQVSGSTGCEWCDKGSYADAASSSQCVTCAIGMTTRQVASHDRSLCVCMEGTFRPAGGDVCSDCPPGMSCREGSDMAPAPNNGTAPITRPEALSGYMTLEEQPLEPYRCLDEALCPGGAPGTCAFGRDGGVVACASCLPGFYSDGRMCRSCRTAGSKVWPAVVLAVCLVLTVIGTLTANRNLMTQTHGGIVTATCLAVLLTAGQTLNIFRQLNINWVFPLSSLLDAMQIMSFDIDILRQSCYLGSSPVVEYAIRQLLILTAVPVVLLTLLAKRRFTETKLVAEMMNAMGSIMNAFYIGILICCLLPLVCYNHPPHAGSYKSSMRSDPSVVCFASKAHSAMLAIGSCTFAVLPLPFTVLVLYSSLKFKKLVAGSSQHSFDSLRFLYTRFVHGRFFYGPVLLLRGLCVCLMPVIFQGTGVQIVVLSAVLHLFGILQVRFFPWRGLSANILDGFITYSLLILLSAGFLFSDDASASSKHTVGVVCFAALMCCCAVAFFMIAYHNRCHHSPRYSSFVCHHKADAAAQARFLKMALHDAGCGRVFIDADDLKNLDDLFEIVRTQTVNLVVFLTRHTLRRPWCAGEVATAYATSKVVVTPVWTLSFVEPSAADLQDLSQYVDETNGILMQYGIDWINLRSAYERLLSESARMIRLQAVLEFSSQHAQLAQAIVRPAAGQDASWTTETLPHLVPQKAGRVVISAESGNPEAAAAACIVAYKVRERLFHIQDSELLCMVHELDTGDKIAIAKLVRSARATVILLSQGSPQSVDQAVVILETMHTFDALRELTTARIAPMVGLRQGRSGSVGSTSTITGKALKAMPSRLGRPSEELVVVLMTLPGFCFFALEQFQVAITGMFRGHNGQIAGYLRAFFNLIAAPLSTHSSDTILEAQLAGIATRIPSQVPMRNAEVLDWLDDLRHGANRSSIACEVDVEPECCSPVLDIGTCVQSLDELHVDADFN